jgi:hypothetical protein
MRSDEKPKNCTHQWVKNGHYETKGRGRVQRWKCHLCDGTRIEIQRVLSDRMIQAFALMANRLTLDEAEDLTNLKSETIRKALLAARANPERWAAIGTCLSHLSIGEEEITYLGGVADEASLTRRCLCGWMKFQPYDKIRLKTAIETIIGEEVIIGRSRQGSRVLRKREFDDFMRAVHKIPIETLKSATLLSLQEQTVLEQLHRPHWARVHALVHAKKCKVDPITLKPVRLEPTLKSLAESLNMDIEQLISVIVSVVRKLRKVTNSDQRGIPRPL